MSAEGIPWVLLFPLLLVFLWIFSGADLATDSPPSRRQLAVVHGISVAGGA